MTTTDYLDEFQALLQGLSSDETSDVLEYYQEYILDAELIDYAAAVAKLGTPHQLARKTLADYSIRQSEPVTRATPRHNARLIWIIILALFASPIAIPLAIAVILMLIAGILVIGAIIFAAMMVVAGLLLAGGFALISGVAILFQSFATGIFYIGVGLAGLGGGILALLIGYMVVKVLLQMGVVIIKYIYHKFQARHQKGARD
ncbi:DUF1700 domain-containing protein [Loigolactobacillus zhaoyuanensis]|uniref:DUF1700 domain-containing protein n=1 Tax=Loigolactobacillus zhaoyuanensis TaxID=2486017 RepID=UPI000F740219|nr:DUF1700 domain-containing protein [Loigolactobacillus zhaoyuanensis]